MDPRDVQRAYDTVASDYARHFPDARAEAPVDLAMVDAFVEAVTERVDAVTESMVNRPETGADRDSEDGTPRVLDAGCGAGRMSRYLADRGLHVTGVDLSPGMVAEARAAHPDITFAVASLTGLPHADASFDGVLVWYSAIHTPPAGQSAVFAEVARVARPGGHVLVGFQSGRGERDVAPSYRRRGHEIELRRYLYPPDEVAALLAGAGLTEVSRLVRRPRGTERDDQVVLLTRREGP